MGHDSSEMAVTFGELGGVGWSVGLIDHDVSRSVCSRLSGIETCRGDSCHFPVLGGGCDSFQDGPPSRMNSLCFSNRGVVRMGAGRGARDRDTTGGGGSSGESSFHFPVNGTY